MPAASEVVSEALLDRVAAARPDLLDELGRVLGTPVGEPSEFVARLRGEDLPGYRALRLVVAGAYYLDAGVRARLGYPGTEPYPVRVSEYPEYVAEGLLDHLLDDVVG
jgi:hypothetical protein